MIAEAIAPRDGTPEAFDEFWAAYPRKVDKGHARIAFAKARKKASAATIIAGAARYATERVGQEARFTKYAKTWLSGECWADEAATPINDHGALIDEHGDALPPAAPESGGRRRRMSPVEAALAVWDARGKP